MTGTKASVAAGPFAAALGEPRTARSALNVLRPVMPLAGARNSDRVQPPPADIGVKRLELDPEPLGSIARGQ
jgi:hypothetical protein